MTWESSVLYHSCIWHVKKDIEDDSTILERLESELAENVLSVSDSGLEGTENDKKGSTKLKKERKKKGFDPESTKNENERLVESTNASIVSNDSGLYVKIV